MVNREAEIERELGRKKLMMRETSVIVDGKASTDCLIEQLTKMKSGN